MDIQVSSNFERYLFEASGRDSKRIVRYMSSLKQSGSCALEPDVAGKLATEFASCAASEDGVANTIRNIYAASGYLLDPHTACAALAAGSFEDSAPTVILATAHPAKFPEAMRAITGIHPALPPRLSRLMTDAERMTHIANDATKIEAHIERAITQPTGARA
jgi:threonine synthase